MEIRIELLGGLRIYESNKLVSGTPTGGVRSALIAFLALNMRSYTRDELIDFLWPEGDIDKSRANLRTNLCNLRKLFGNVKALNSDNAGIRLNREVVVTDTGEFWQAIQAAEKAEDVDAKIRCRCQAVDLYRGAFLEGQQHYGPYENWFIREQQHFEGACLGTIESLVVEFLHSNDLGKGITFAHRAIEINPYSPVGYSGLMRLHFQLGEYGLAFSHYDTFVQRLKSSTGEDPPPDLQRFAAKIRSRQKETTVAFVDVCVEGYGIGADAEEGKNHRQLSVVAFGSPSDGRPRQKRHDQDVVARLRTDIFALMDLLGGKLLKWKDGPLIVFGLDNAREADPLAALSCGLGIRDAAARLGMPIALGIETGEAVVTDHPTAPRVVGPVLETAIYLRRTAAANEIRVGEFSYEIGRERFRFLPAAISSTEPIDTPVWMLINMYERAQQAGESLCPLYGRERPLTDLLNITKRLCEGQGHTLSIEGEPGVGKTRLIQELKKILLPYEETIWLDATCSEMAQQTSLWLFRELLADYFNFHPEEDPSQRLLHLDRELSTSPEFQGWSELQKQQLRQVLTDVFGLTRATNPVQWARETMAEGREEQICSVLRDLISTIASRRPLILALDNLQWVDPLSLNVLRDLIVLTGRERVLLLCINQVLSNSRIQKELWRAERKAVQVNRIHLDGLTRPESDQMVDGLRCEEPASEELKERIWAGAGGNPFLIEQTMRTHRTYRFGTDQGGTVVITALPLSHRGEIALQSRFDSLPHGLRRVLQKAAIIGQVFRKDLLAATTDEVSDVDSALWQLEKTEEILEFGGESTVETYRFRHDLLRQSVYRAIPKVRRARYHRMTAENIERLYSDTMEKHRLIAYHYKEARLSRSAVDAITRAGDHALAAGLFTEAHDWFKEALRQPGLHGPGNEQLARLKALEGLSWSCYMSGQAARAEQHAQKALDIALDLDLNLDRLASLYHLLGETLWWQGKFEKILSHRTQVEQFLAGKPTLLARALLNQFLAIAYRGLNDITTFQRYTSETAKFLPELPYEKTYALYHQIVDMYRQRKRPEEALRWLQTHEDLARTLGHELAIGGTHHSRGEVLFDLGRFREALAEYKKGVAHCRRLHYPKTEHWCLASQARCELALGEVDAAEATCRSYLEREDIIKVAKASDLAALYLWYGACLFNRSALVEAAQVFQRAKQLAHKSHSDREIDTLIALGRTFIAQGRLSSAAKLLEKALRLATEANRLMMVRSALHARSRIPGSPMPDWLSAWMVEHDFQWSLEPADGIVPLTRSETVPFSSDRWIVDDPRCYVLADGTLTIHAENGEDLRALHLNAPRLLMRVEGQFIAETLAGPASDSYPALGGLLLWAAQDQFLRLTFGIADPTEVAFHGSIGGSDTQIGQGRLASQRRYLRLERQGIEVVALCSEEGQRWWQVGKVEFGGVSPVYVGIHGTANFSRLVYPGPHPQSSYVHFEMFRLREP